MPISAAEKLDLLNTVSFARNNSNSYMDTIGNSAIVGFLQAQDVLRTIGSKPNSMSSIDILLPFLMSLAIDAGGGLLVKSITKKIMKRVVNSRVIVGTFNSKIPGVKTTNTTKLYAGVSKRFDFNKYADALKAHRIEQAHIKIYQIGAGALYSNVISKQIKQLLAGQNNNRPVNIPGVSATVSIVESALFYSVYQKLITNNLFDELKNSIILDTSNDRKFYEEIEIELLKLHEPIKESGFKNIEMSLSEINKTFIHYFEKLIWCMVFFGDNPYKTLSLKGVRSGELRIQYFGNITKDVELTQYLLRNFSRNKKYYSANSNRNFHHPTERNKLVDDFRKIAKKLKSREEDFGPSIIEIK